MSRYRGMMRDFDGRDRRLARLDAINEVAVVAFSLIDHDFAFFRRQGTALTESGIGSFKAAAINPHPTVTANPLGAAANVAVSTGNGHFNIVRVFRSDAIFCASVPNRIFGGEFSFALDFRRTNLVVVAEAPVSDVAVMADPVQQLAAADIVIPAPVLVHPAFDIRLHLGGADPNL